MHKAKIIGTGSYLPKKVVSNEDLAKRIETSDEWIKSRVGISSRHMAGSDETTAFMATQAAKAALIDANLSAEKIDLIVVGTSTPDHFMPSTATEVQANLSITNCCPAFDISAACAGFIYAMSVANQFFHSDRTQNVLVIGVDRMSRLLNWNDRATCVLFGDGAGAVVLQTSQDDSGILSSNIHADGAKKELLYAPSMLSHAPYDKTRQPHFLAMHGPRVMKSAVTKLVSCIEMLLSEHELTSADIDWVIPHQANQRIIDAAAQKVGISPEKVIMTLETHGNTSAASVPLALDVARRDGRVKKGDLVLLEAFGAGFVWGGILLRY